MATPLRPTKQFFSRLKKTNAFLLINIPKVLSFINYGLRLHGKVFQLVLSAALLAIRTVGLTWLSGRKQMLPFSLILPKGGRGDSWSLISLLKLRIWEEVLLREEVKQHPICEGDPHKEKQNTLWYYQNHRRVGALLQVTLYFPIIN